MSKLAEINAELNALDWDPPLVKCLTVERPKSRRKPKGPTARRIAKRRRAEWPVAKAVRAQCVDRDGYCIFQLGAGYVAVVGCCDGYSEWMHVEAHKRARTRGMEPDKRHTVAGSMMGCTSHHTLYDRGRISLGLTATGTNGPIRVESHRGVYMIPARDRRCDEIAL